jgi:hypothetical protein
MSLREEWKDLAGSIRDAGLKIFETADIPRTAKGFADVKVLAVTLLARTVSNVKATLLLVEARRIVEARTITRGVFENLYWIVGLAEEGEAFVRKMRDDDMSHSHARGRDIFKADVDLDAGVSDRLRAYLSANIVKAKSLAPKQVASIRSDFEKTYIFYGQLSSDATGAGKAIQCDPAGNRGAMPKRSELSGSIGPYRFTMLPRRMSSQWISRVS